VVIALIVGKLLLGPNFDMDGYDSIYECYERFWVDNDDHKKCGKV